MMSKFRTVFTITICIITLSQFDVHSKPFPDYTVIKPGSYPSSFPFGIEQKENEKTVDAHKILKREVRLNDYEISLLNHILQLGDKADRISGVQDGFQNRPPNTIIGEIKRPIRMAQRSRYRNCYFSPGQCFYLMSSANKQN